ncbi:MAG TPA: hypothetical protein VEB68_06135 [Croceibacterium sp.]|nr:hypothetical protein [Croceibacterium sp.]
MDQTTAQQQQSPPPTGVTLARPAIVALLYLLNIFLGFSVFVGLVLAYIWRNDADTQEWERSHYRYLIRTFWIGLAVFLGVFIVWIATIFGTAFDQSAQDRALSPAFPLVFVGAIVVWLLGAVWFCIRSILSLVKAGEGKPMPRPESWLF